MGIGLVPDKFVFISLLNALNHSGNAIDAEYIWRHEIDDVHVQYDQYVIASLIDCYSRAGRLKQAFDLIIEYENHSQNNFNEVMWTSLLSGCRKHKNVKMTKNVYKHMQNRFDLTDPNSSITTLLKGLE